nr:ral guanine nucleotide dissociation stimulator-like [Dasypus novemcinctus]
MREETHTVRMVKAAPAPGVAPTPRLEEAASPSLSPVPELEAIAPLPPVPPAQFTPVPIVELPPLNPPSAALTLEGETSVAPPPEPLPVLKPAPGWAAQPEPSCTWPESSEHRLSRKADLLTFPPELVAEQLTRRDAELFKKVVPYHCLGSIWSQCNKKGKEHLAPTIRATITQFNYVTNCVITTCLGDWNMKAPDRARVVEHWIEVAKECRILRNFSSFYAVISALQSHSIHRLKKTWQEVSRDSFHLFQKLSEMSPNDNNYSQSKERLIKKGIFKLSTLKMNPKRTQKQQQQERPGKPPFSAPPLEPLGPGAMGILGELFAASHSKSWE